MHVKLLARSPEMDYELFQVHTNRHTGHRGLPASSRPPSEIQEKACGPESVMLRPRNQPSGSVRYGAPSLTNGAPRAGY